MANDKEMELMIKITAKGEAALRELKKVENVMNRWADNISSKASLVGGVFGVLGKGGGLILKPFEWAGKAALGLTAGLLALGGAALKAASDDQKLIDRLTMVYGSAEKGKAVFEELESISRRSQFKADDLTEATIVMKQFGMDGTRNLSAVANAAKIADESVGQMAMAVAGLQSRGLKRAGIDLDVKGDNYTATWYDKMGKVQKIVAKGADAARKMVVDIFALKGGTNLTPTSLSGFVQMLKNNIDDVFKTVGTPLLDLASRFVGSIAAKLTRLIESGKLEEMGKKAAEWLQNAWNEGEAFFTWVKGIWENLDAGGLMKALGVVMGAAAKILATSFVIYLRGLWDVFGAIGNAIGAAFGETMLQLPGMGLVRNKMAGNEIANQVESGGYGKMMKDLGIAKGAELTDRDMARIAMYSKSGNMGKSALDTFQNKLPALFSEASGNVAEIMRQTGTELNGLAPGAPTMDEARAEQQRQRDRDAAKARAEEQDKMMAKVRADAEAQIGGKDLATYTVAPLMRDNTGQTKQGAMGGEITGEIPGGRFAEGQTVSRGGVNIYIEKVVSAASRTEELVKDMISKAGSPALAAAGG